MSVVWRDIGGVWKGVGGCGKCVCICECKWVRACGKFRILRVKQSAPSSLLSPSLFRSPLIPPSLMPSLCPSVSTHWSLLFSLNADNCLSLLTLLLLEQKVVLHSSRPALLTCVGEALRSILFPFSWQCTYIPLCPLAFSSYMQAPVPFIIGEGVGIWVWG